MANSPTGKWVARAASTGGGRTYRGQMPVNWYATLALICVVGLVLVVYSRYERTHLTSVSSGAPTTAESWSVALGIDICGTMEPNLPATTSTLERGFTAGGNGVLTIAPKNSSESGGNATLGKFVSEYKGLVLTSSSLQYPGKPLLSNGQRCPKGNPDAGKQGFVTVDVWPNLYSKTPTGVSGDPLQLKFANAQMITVAFVPATAMVPKPPTSAVMALRQVLGAGPSSKPTATVPTATVPTATVPTATVPTATTTKSPGGSAK